MTCFATLSVCGWLGPAVGGTSREGLTYSWQQLALVLPTPASLNNNTLRCHATTLDYLTATCAIITAFLGNNDHQIWQCMTKPSLKLLDRSRHASA